jgi:hypothetical protein
MSDFAQKAPLIEQIVARMTASGAPKGDDDRRRYFTTLFERRRMLWTKNLQELRQLV